VSRLQSACGQVFRNGIGDWSPIGVRIAKLDSDASTHCSVFGDHRSGAAEGRSLSPVSAGIKAVCFNYQGVGDGPESGPVGPE
jgi:hypothetical protein